MPAKAMMIVLSLMNYLDRLSFSICSKAAKLMIKKSKLDIAIDAKVEFKTHLRIEIMFEENLGLDLYVRIPFEGREAFVNLEPSMITSVKAIRQEEADENSDDEDEFERNRWSYEHLNAKAWLDHCQDIYRIKSIEVYVQDYPCVYNYATYRSLFENHTVRNLYFERKSADNIASPLKSLQELLNIKLPERKLEVVTGVFDDPMSIQKTCIRKIEYVTLLSRIPIFDLHPIRPFFSLDDLLVSNAGHLLMDGEINITAKDLNKFLHHWIRGSNKNLKFLNFSFRERAPKNFTGLLKGIRSEGFPAGTSRVVYVPTRIRNEMERYELSRGVNIQSADGRVGSIEFRAGNNGISWFWFCVDGSIFVY